MKIYAALGLAALMTGFGVAGAQAQVSTKSVYVYNFNDIASTVPATGVDQTTAFSVDRVNGINTPNGSPLSSLSTTFAAANISSFGGSTLNADGPDGAGQDLALLGGGATGAIANNGAYLQATANLTGLNNIGFSFAGRRSGTGFNNDTLSYSVDGGQTFTTFMSGINLTNGTYTVQPFDFSGVTALNNNANAQFRLTFDGATTAAGNNRLDNLIITGDKITGTVTPPVPEASTTVSLGLMLALGGLAFAVKKKKANVAL